jgi:hypothetical protein
MSLNLYFCRPVILGPLFTVLKETEIRMMQGQYYKNSKFHAGGWWLTPAIRATQETAIRRIEI